MLTILFAVTTGICAFGWLNSWVARAAIIKFLLDKKYTPPTDDEAKACAEYVWKKLLKRQ